MKERRIPMRMCVGCREMKPKKELLRIVHSPEGSFSTDPTGKRPGRGAYVCRNPECFMKAIKQRQLEKAFSCAVSQEQQQELKTEFDRLVSDGLENGSQ